MRNLPFAVLTTAVMTLVVGCGKGNKTSGIDPTGGPPTTQGSVEHVFDGPCDMMGSPFGAGAGTGTSPYLICSAAQLQNLANPAYGAASFQLHKDLDLSGIAL